MNKCRMSELRLNIHGISLLRTNIHIINTHNNNTLNPEERILEAEDKEEDLVAEEAKLYVIIVGNLDTFPWTTRVLLRNVYIENILVTLPKNILS